jgi:hypothetical protein
MFGYRPPLPLNGYSAGTRLYIKTRCQKTFKLEVRYVNQKGALSWEYSDHQGLLTYDGDVAMCWNYRLYGLYYANVRVSLAPKEDYEGSFDNSYEPEYKVGDIMHGMVIQSVKYRQGYIEYCGVKGKYKKIDNTWYFKSRAEYYQSSF